MGRILINNTRQTIVIHSFKGGVGKTAITTNLSYFLSQKKNKRILLIDGDIAAPSYRKVFESKFKLERILTWTDFLDEKYEFLSGETMKNYIHKTKYPNLDIIYSPLPELGKKFLSEKSLDWWTSALRNAFLAKELALGELDYDYMIIDNQSGILMNSVNNLTLANIIILVLRPIAYGIDGTAEMIKSIYSSIRNVTNNLWKQKVFLIWNQIPYDLENEKEKKKIDAFIEEWNENFETNDFLGIAKIPYDQEYTSSMLKYNENELFGLSNFVLKEIESFWNSVLTVLNRETIKDR